MTMDPGPSDSSSAAGSGSRSQMDITTQEETKDTPVIAKPDIESTPSENKKKKLYHIESDSESQVAAEDQNRNEEVKEQNDDVVMDEQETPSAVQSTLNPSASISKSLVDLEMPPQTPTPHHAHDDAAFSSTASSSSASSSTPSSSIPREDPRPGPDQDQDQDSASTAVQAVPLAEELEQQEEWWELKMTWSGKAFDLKVGGNDMVYDFRHLISQLTGVSPDAQKLINLLPGSKGKLSVEHDAKRFGTLGVKKGAKFIMVGTREEDRFKKKGEVGGEMMDDFDVTYSNANRGLHPADDPRNKRKILEICANIPITVMNEPREGKKLLVLDLDYTIVDTKPLISGALPSMECARPGLHEFLEAVYPHYDIVIWSQTHWRWLESKLVELEMIGSERNYKVSFVADRTTMFPVWTQRNGKPFKHEVKPLAYFWNTFPQWSAKNSIHIDDLSRNFALNPGEGLKIRPYNKAGQAEGLADQELIKLGRYLINIATVEDFTTLDHSKWKKKNQSANL
ncbi:HAD hydrolase, family IIID [Kwoniella dejecticola CBS 10117]|uniref:HAD hydrolase, family IIID n=1 Tax=Kwoniella dejecticola CBS 10117 TaxID=1296121 RepID=A0A1A6A3C4_9TREE|nr:HAD hydrolase, family IIID [Kwoniella dejecticola CBS 10117]OBR84556.1 HAD hydrolase, family IIID [Kwoniella dejecticola CBS 10117]